MVLQNPHSYPASPTPTIDVSFDRLNESALPPPPPLWPHRLSASFSAMADQIAAASQALALVPSTAFSGTDVSADLGALRSRLEGIEQTQGRMMAEFEALKTQFTTVGINVNGNGVESGGGGVATDAAAQTAKIEALEKKLNELSETVKIDQERLPARLHNSRATVMKATLKTPVAANGKPVAGFPISRGEFEHITKERYEALMKGYGMPLKGDTAAKREALRLFAGIPQDGQ
ncbi:hypothetical protein OG21DRAFT_907849 [Imleria badia]|nr:hypothetical protein OG21DRAFT_907849 [Imleria badia]